MDPLTRADLHQTIAPMQADISELKADVCELKADVCELKADVRDLKSNQDDFKTQLTQQGGTLAELTRLVVDMSLTFPQTMRDIARESEQRMVGHIEALYARSEAERQEQLMLGEQMRRAKRRQRDQARVLGDHEERLTRLETPSG